MARARNIKPSIMDNEELAELEPLTRLLFIYLWMLADREGRLEDRPKRIAAQALAYDRNADVDAMLNSLQSLGFIARYSACGIACIQITSFTKHQTPHIREAVSTLPKQEQAPTKAGAKHSLGSAETLPRSPDSLIPDSLIPDSLIPDSSGTNVPAADGGEKELTKAELWTAGKSLLAEQGMPKAQCGSFVGKLVKDYTDEIVIDAVRSAVVTRPADAASYLVSICQARAGLRQARASPESFAERDERLARERYEAAIGKRTKTVIDAVTLEIER